MPAKRSDRGVSGPSADRASPERSGERSRSDESRGDASGGDRTRRRRRRGGRRRSEKPGEERASKSRSRGSRRDFAPVAGSFDEDDEGLEFLGLDEATQQKPRGDAATDDQDVLAESGLADVLDVPSWVEAIGIVIAGNLDARSRSRDDRHR
jgi:hypothetical protein